MKLGHAKTAAKQKRRYSRRTGMKPLVWAKAYILLEYRITAAKRNGESPNGWA